MISLQHLKTFITLYKEKSFVKTAKLQFMTQSAVSQQIKALEEELKAKLIERTNRRLLVTPLGEKVYEQAVEILQKCDELHHIASQEAVIPSGVLRLAVVESVGVYLLPPYLAQFRSRYPLIDVRIEYGRSEEVYEKVQNGTGDCGLVAFPDARRNLTTIPFYEEDMVLIVGLDHPLAHQSQISVRQIQEMDYIALRKNQSTQQAVDQFLAQHGLTVHIRNEVANFELVKRNVGCGFGISIVPRSVIRSDEIDFKVLPFQNASFKRPVALVYRKKTHLTSAMKQFTNLLIGAQPA